MANDGITDPDIIPSKAKLYLLSILYLWLNTITLLTYKCQKPNCFMGCYAPFTQPRSNVLARTCRHRQTMINLLPGERCTGIEQVLVTCFAVSNFSELAYRSRFTNCLGEAPVCSIAPLVVVCPYVDHRSEFRSWHTLCPTTPARPFRVVCLRKMLQECCGIRTWPGEAFEKEALNYFFSVLIFTWCNHFFRIREKAFTEAEFVCSL